MVAIVIGLALVVTTTVAAHAEYIPVIGLAFGVFLQQALCAALTSERKYTKIATIRFFPNAVFFICFFCLMAFSKGECTGFGIFNLYSWIFLASNFCLASIYLYSARRMIPVTVVKFSALQIQYAKYGVPTTALNSFVIYASAILIPLIFDHRDAGIFALAYRVGYFPASLLSQSLGAIFRRDLVDYFDVERQGGVNPSKQFFTMLTLISLALVAACYAGLSLLIHLKMGDEWEPSMSVYVLFIPYFITMAMYSSMAQVFIVVNRQKIDLVIQTASAVTIFMSLALAHFFGLKFFYTLLLISVGGTIVASAGTCAALKIGKGSGAYRTRQPGLETQ
ncbi:lipopolysaccharide biosynthesis protein [Caballeronia sp. 15711]|uniref:lipopolysaccharide biosynthesis protein n=1 Tax=Caballeronia sp. 15711 TaxID=3391029 RepID=UPI0039E28B84